MKDTAQIQKIKDSVRFKLELIIHDIEENEKEYIEGKQSFESYITGRETYRNDILDLFSHDDYQEVLDLELMKDEDIGVVHKAFRSRKTASPSAYDYLGGEINGRNQLRRSLRKAIAEKRGKDGK